MLQYSIPKIKARVLPFNSAFEQVKLLVNDFTAHEARYLSPEYSEAQVRKDFIDKLFIALGWDVNHDTQKNPYEQEVTVERNVTVGAAWSHLNTDTNIYKKINERLSQEWISKKKKYNIVPI